MATITRSLTGHYRDEPLFSLQQGAELHDIYREKIRACDTAIERQLCTFEDQGDPEHRPPMSKRKKKTKNAPHFDVRGHLYRITGVDLTRIEGIDESTALKVVSEIGTNVSRWKTEKHFASWLCLSPGNKVSGGKVLNTRTNPSANRAAAALRLAAFALTHSKSALGAYCRRMRARLGAPKAITATAHKLARLIYSMLKYGTEYVDRGQDNYEREYRARAVRNLTEHAAHLGFTLLPNTPDPAPSLNHGSMT